PPADPPKLARALTRVLEDPALAPKMGMAGRARVLQHFTWDRIAEKTLALYRSLT
ncbi:MAG: glycosyltransferase, partial [Candidatus Thermoplasmatota archaeon]